MKKVKELREQNNCLFSNDICESNGKYKNEKNHAIAKSALLKKISHKNQVMVFAWEERDFYKNNGKLSKRNIKNANTYRVLCGKHDKLLFNEIEDGKKFDEHNSKQLFQFAFRSLIFEYSHSKIKSNFDDLVPDIFNKVADAHLIYNTRNFEDFKELYDAKRWDGVKHDIIKLKKQISFVSSFYTRPIWKINKMYLFSTQNISINIFPQDEYTFIILSRIANKSKSIDNYCKNLKKLAQKDEDKFLKYISKLVISSDKNIAINPCSWENTSKENREDFYKCAHFFSNNNSKVSKLLFKAIKYNFYSCKCNLFDM